MISTSKFGEIQGSTYSFIPYLPDTFTAQNDILKKFSSSLYILSSAEIAIINNALSLVSLDIDYNNSKDLKLLENLLFSKMSDFLNVIDTLGKKATSQKESGFFLIRGFGQGIGTEKELMQLSNLIVFSMALTIGRPYGYIGQRNGAVIQTLTPKIETSTEQVGTNSVDLLWHSEDAHSPVNCDWIELFCVRGDDRAKTLLSTIDLSKIDREIISILEGNHYTMLPDSSVDNISSGITFPVLDLSNPDRIKMRFDPLFTKVHNLEAFNALKILHQHLNDNAFELTLQVGDLLLINNSNSVHARTSFTPRYDGTDRLLSRTAVLTKEPPSQFLLPDNPYLISYY